MPKMALHLAIPLALFAVCFFTNIVANGDSCSPADQGCGGQKEICQTLEMEYVPRDPNAYPTRVMDRYNFVRLHYRILRFFVDCYFTLVNALFGLYNAFLPVDHVGQWQNASKLLFIPANEAAQMIRNKQLSSVNLVSAYIDRIQAVNPMLNALVYNNFAAARRQAAAVDARLAKLNASQRDQLAKKEPLLGVPFTSKNNLENTGFVITACNQAFIDANVTSTVDAPVVARVKAAGAILLGITGMPNLGLSYYCDDSACGVMNNPHDVRRTTGGSSSGEAALSGSGASVFGLGNDIGGSLRVPTHNCGVFGLKPTSYPSHVVPVEGIIPNFAAYEPAAEMLSNGIITRYPSDFPLLLSILANKNVSDYDKKVDFAKKFRIFYQEELDVLVSEALEPEVRDQVRRVKGYFEEKYNLTAPRIQLPLMNRELEMWALTGYTPGVPPIYPNMTTEFSNLLHTKKGGQLATTWVLSQHQLLRSFISPKNDIETEFVTEKKEKLRRELGTLLGQDGVLVMPILPTDVPFHHTEPFKPFNLVYAKLINVLGLPAMAVPTGKSASSGMPMGIQVIASPFNEALLIAVAQELEIAFGGWVAPGTGPF